MWAMAKNLVVPDSKVIRRFDVEDIEHLKDSEESLGTERLIPNRPWVRLAFS